MGLPQLEPFKADVETEAQDEQYTVWLRAKVQESLNDPRPPVAHDTAIARMYAAIERGVSKKNDPA